MKPAALVLLLLPAAVFASEDQRLSWGITPLPLSTFKLHDPDQRQEATLEVWIDLSLPPLGEAKQEDPEARAALRARIAAQQDRVMAQLTSLGAKEIARVAIVRNAIAVRMPAAALAQARAIPGVVNVRAVKHRHRIE